MNGTNDPIWAVRQSQLARAREILAAAGCELDHRAAWQLKALERAVAQRSEELLALAFDSAPLHGRSHELSRPAIARLIGVALWHLAGQAPEAAVRALDTCEAILAARR